MADRDGPVPRPEEVNDKMLLLRRKRRQLHALLLLAQETADRGRQVSRQKEVNDEMLLGPKRKRKNLPYSSESTSEDSSSAGSRSLSSSTSSGSETSSGGSSSSSSSTSSRSETFSSSWSSSDIDSGSEYYYSSENHTDSESSLERVWIANSRKVRKLLPRGAPSSQRGAGKWNPLHYRKILGEGSFGVVYLAYSKANNINFAVKCAKPFRRGAFKILTREADVLKQLNSPYIIEYLGERRAPMRRNASTSDTRPKSMVLMVTEIYLPYMKRGTLSNEIRRYRKKKQMMEENVIRNYTKQILSGLSYLHSKNIVHCDIKGSNILMGKTNLKISDFGVSKHIGNPSENRRFSRAGTKAWMAPEVHMRKEQGFPADVWSFGCTIVQMITGKPPVTSELESFLCPETVAERRHPYLIPEEFKRLSSECIDFLKKCFLKDIKARWTCQQLLDHPFLKRT